MLSIINYSTYISLHSKWNMNSTPLNWPPPFTLRKSLRARSIRLQICARKGLQLIVPRGFNPQEAGVVLQQHRRWIERAWGRIEPQAGVKKPIRFPEQLQLLALDEVWQVHYYPMDINLVRLQVNAVRKQLTLHGKTSNLSLVRCILLTWLKKRAKHSLILQLEEISKQTGLHYSKVSIRNTTTRWGSCSAKKNISLNCKLLFLPPKLVDHVLLHELCHTVHLNHSRQFWDLVRTFDADCHDLRKQLKQAHRYMPDWFEE